MAVAKTYERMEIQGEPFKENGRMYVNVRAHSGLKKVRWYSDAEYARMYPNAQQKSDIMDFDARYAFGFRDAGFITIYNGTAAALDRFVETNRQQVRRNLTFGCYTPSYIETPVCPPEIETYVLKWDEVKDHDNRMKDHELVSKYISKIFNKNLNFNSAFQGEIGTWIERDIVISNNELITNHFGEKHIHSMIDANGNVYKWETGTKDYEVGTARKLKMKAKEHKDMNGLHVTIVWYCKEV